MRESVMLCLVDGVKTKIRCEYRSDADFPYYALVYEGVDISNDEGEHWYVGWNWAETRSFSDKDARAGWINSVRGVGDESEQV